MSALCHKTRWCAGELFFIGYQVDTPPFCWLGALDAEGRLMYDCPVPLPKGVMCAAPCALTLCTPGVQASCPLLSMIPSSWAALMPFEGSEAAEGAPSPAA